MPVAAFEEAAERLASLQGPALRVQPGQCLNLRHLRAGCRACAEVCPTGAIRWGRELRVEPFDCAECGACASACPTGALEAADQAWQRRLARISQAADDGGTVLFACPLHLKRDRALRGRPDLVEVPCIGAVEPWELLAAVTFGASAVWLLAARCARCSHRAAHAQAERALEAARALLAAWGRREEVRLITEAPASPATGSPWRGLAGWLPRRGPDPVEELARRGLDLSSLAGQGPAAATPGEGLERQVPAAHHRLLFFLGRLGDPVAERIGAGAPLAGLEIDPQCTGCGMCGYFCPTGALSKREQDGKTQIVFREQACTRCGLCARLCYQGAVRMMEARPAAVLSGEEQTLWDGCPSTPGERLWEAARRLV